LGLGVLPGALDEGSNIGFMLSVLAGMGNILSVTVEIHMAAAINSLNISG
jgi:hypothetical protein